jgi:hypothetical protein
VVLNSRPSYLDNRNQGSSPTAFYHIKRSENASKTGLAH